ncbi:CPBP family intramembrane glutamic endopeptidase [Streptococcus suis]
MYFDTRTNATLLSILVAILLDLSQGSFLFSISWLINILILGNAKRMGVESSIRYFLRISGYFLHLGFFAFIGYLTLEKFESKNTILSLLFLVFFLLLSVYKEYDILRFKLSDISIASTKIKYPKFRYIILIYNYIGAAICEELYFRYFIIGCLSHYGVYTILLSAVYFVLFHYTTLWGNSFKKSDYMKQLLFGIIFSTLYFYSKNIFITIIGHICLNIPQIYLMIKLYHRDYINPDHYNNLLLKDDLDDLLI